MTQNTTTKAGRETITLEEIITFLLETPMFEGLDAAELSTIVKIMQMMRVRDGQVVFREGDEGDAWYVVFEGTVEVTKRQSGEGEAPQSRVVAELGTRACFGEMAILDGSPRSAGVRALGECMLFRFPRSAFGKLLARESTAAYKLVLEMAKVLCQRQRELTLQLTEMMNEYQEVRKHVEPIVNAQSLSE